MSVVASPPFIAGSFVHLLFVLLILRVIHVTRDRDDERSRWQEYWVTVRSINVYLQLSVNISFGVFGYVLWYGLSSFI